MFKFNLINLDVRYFKEFYDRNKNNMFTLNMAHVSDDKTLIIKNEIIKLKKKVIYPNRFLCGFENTYYGFRGVVKINELCSCTPFL